MARARLFSAGTSSMNTDSQYFLIALSAFARAAADACLSWNAKKRIEKFSASPRTILMVRRKCPVTGGCGTRVATKIRYGLAFKVERLLLVG
jgi:hypothetical protein